MRTEGQAAASSFPTADGAFGGHLCASEYEEKQKEDDPPAWAKTEAFFRRRAAEEAADFQRSREAEEDEWIGVAQALMADGEEGASAVEILQRQCEAELAALQRRHLAEEEAGERLGHGTISAPRVPTVQLSLAQTSSSINGPDSEEKWAINSHASSRPRPPNNAEPTPPTMEEPLAVNPPRFARPQITVKEDVNFLLFLAYMTQEEVANMFARHDMFCAAHSRQQRQLSNVDADGKGVVGSDTNRASDYVFFDHTEGFHGADIPINTVRFIFSLWFVFKYPQRKREKSSRSTRQRMKLPSRASLQLTWNYFYERLHAIQAIVQRLLDSARAAPFFRQAIQLALPQDHGEDNQSDNNQNDGNQNDDSE